MDEEGVRYKIDKDSHMVHWNRFDWNYTEHPETNKKQLQVFHTLEPDHALIFRNGKASCKNLYYWIMHQMVGTWMLSDQKHHRDATTPGYIFESHLSCWSQKWQQTAVKKKVALLSGNHWDMFVLLPSGSDWQFATEHAWFLVDLPIQNGDVEKLC